MCGFWTSFRILANRRFLRRRPVPWPACIPQSERFTLSTFLNIAKGAQSETFTLWNACRPRGLAADGETAVWAKSRIGAQKPHSRREFFGLTAKNARNRTRKPHTRQPISQPMPKSPNRHAENARSAFCDHAFWTQGQCDPAMSRVTVCAMTAVWHRSPLTLASVPIDLGVGPHWPWRRSPLTLASVPIDLGVGPH